MSDPSTLSYWLKEPEGERLEFKEAKGGFEFEKLVKYCVALANEGGGKIILGVSDKRPRRVVGSGAFPEFERTKAGLLERIHLRVEAEVVNHPNGRVLVFDVPSRPVGMPVQYKATYWMRAGDSLVPMTPDKLKRIFDEGTPDYSAEICAVASLNDLEPEAIDRFRHLWIAATSNISQKRTLESLPVERLLADAELVLDGGVTYAAMILLGTARSLGRYLAQSEVVFEYRSSDASIEYQQRENFRRGFFLFRDELWNLINLRNDQQSFQDGFVVRRIPMLNERVVREAILNAVGHREYRKPESIFIRQFPTRVEVISPGGLPDGITPATILRRQIRRNRRIVENLERCDLVERSGQGMDLIFKECIRESKPRPDFTNTDEYQVSLTLRGEIQDERFLRFLEKVGQDRVASFTLDDFLVLDLAHQGKRVPPDLKPRIAQLVEHGVIESVGGGQYMLSRQFYAFVGQTGHYTRVRGLSREANKQLLLKHIQDSGPEGCKLEELLQVLPALTRNQVQDLLKNLKSTSLVHTIGRTNAARWRPGGGEGSRAL